MKKNCLLLFALMLSTIMFANNLSTEKEIVKQGKTILKSTKKDESKKNLISYKRSSYFTSITKVENSNSLSKVNLFPAKCRHTAAGRVYTIYQATNGQWVMAITNPENSFFDSASALDDEAEADNICALLAIVADD